MERIQKNVEVLATVVAGLRASGKRIVLAVGVFDLLHAGHIRYLTDAAHRGDYLIVGIQEDAAVRRTLGAGRPLFPAGERAAVLAALSCVHYVTFFGETDASALVRKLKPDVVVRGRDTNETTIPERAAAEEVKTQLAIVGDGKIYSSKEVLETFRKRSAARAARET